QASSHQRGGNQGVDKTDLTHKFKTPCLGKRPTIGITI
ncbi:hypothetical protein ACUW9M_005313, partial [Serratia sp. 121840015-2]